MSYSKEEIIEAIDEGLHAAGGASRTDAECIFDHLFKMGMIADPALPLAERKSRMVCRTCRSPNVECDAFAQWEEATQLWVTSNTFDKGSNCTDCDGETRIEDITLVEGSEDPESNPLGEWDEDKKEWVMP
jgi:hypothetical protein